MRELTELPAWERLLKKIVWAQLGDIQGKNVLDLEVAKELLQTILRRITMLSLSSHRKIC